MERKPRLPKMPGSGRATRPRASLVAAAAASESQPPPPAQQPLFDDPDADDPMEDTKEDTKEDTREVYHPTPTSSLPPPSAAPTPSASAPTPSAPTASSSTQVQGARTEPAKMKFKPRMPIRRTVQEDTKPDISSASASSSSRGARGGLRGRGRGGMRGGGRGGATVSTVAAGPFGGNRPSASRRIVAPPPPSRGLETVAVEVYSDNEDGTRTGVIDIDAVSGLSESAPTSVYRARDLDGGKAAAKANAKQKIKEQKERRRRQKAVRSAVLGSSNLPSGSGEGGVFVKAEPVSPMLTANAALPSVREGDSMLPSDQQQDRDESDRRVRATTDLSTMSGTPDVNEAQRVDLSESEDEEFEEDLAGDFVFAPGGEHPEDKLFTFQFPHLFPKFKEPPPPPSAEPDASASAAGANGANGAAAVVEEDKKPKLSALRGAKKATPPPTGRIGTLVVMKSGKVKMVMGSGDDAVVMDVSPGVSSTFLQQLVHVDPKTKNMTVAGEVHKSYVVTPDVDRLLDELFINGGETPGDKERRAGAGRVKMERGVKMEMD